MFKPLLDALDQVYTDDIIYLPEIVYDTVIKWMEGQTKFNTHHSVNRQVFLYRGKKLVPFDEEAMLNAYQSVPIHVPARILEKTIVIETSLEPKPIEPEREEVKKEQPKPETVRYGRREGTKSKSFNELF